jgi:hypothetical protein
MGANKRGTCDIGPLFALATIPTCSRTSITEGHGASAANMIGQALALMQLRSLTNRAGAAGALNDVHWRDL